MSRRPYVGLALLVALGWNLLAARSVGAADAQVASSEEPSAVWNQWRGATRDGRSTAAPWAEGVGEEHLEQVWTVPLQPSYSGPIVHGDMIFTTETVDEESERVTAYDRNSGKLLWERSWKGAMKVPFFARSNGSWIRATPACDGERLYVAGIRDVLVALDAKSGEIVWQLDFVEKFKSPLPSFGFVSSPLVDGEEIYVQAGAAVMKLNKRTGEVLWSSLSDGGGMGNSAFSSPVIATIRGKRQLVVQTREKLAGVSLEDGSEIWSQVVEAFRGMNILTPTIWSDRLFTSSYGGKAWTYELTQADGKMSVQQKWENKLQGYMSSPVLIDGYIYLHLRNRRFTCIEAETGEVKWTTQPFGEYWSMVAQGDRILALDERGELLMIRANPEKFDLLSQRKISSESAWAHLGNDGNQLFVRDLKNLTVYRWK